MRVPLGAILSPLALQLTILILATPILSRRSSEIAVAVADTMGALVLTEVALTITTSSLAELELPKEVRIAVVAMAIVLMLSAMLALVRTKQKGVKLA